MGLKIRVLDVVLTYLVCIIPVVIFPVVMLRFSRSRGWWMSHRGRSAQLCPEKERGETD